MRKGSRGDEEMADWQPIETAPKDGTDVLLWDGMGVALASYCAAMPESEFREQIADEPYDAEQYFEYLDEIDEGWTHYSPTSGDLEIIASPTHWMPLPAPPAQGMEARRAETGTGSVEDDSPVTK
jgi:uncharacterized protein DUF551